MFYNCHTETTIELGSQKKTSFPDSCKIKISGYIWDFCYIINTNQ